MVSALKPALVLVCMLFFLFPCKGTLKVFTQLTGNNNWDIDANWNPTGVPLLTDDVVIPYTSSVGYTVTIASQAECQSLALGELTGASVAAPWDPALAQTLQITSGSLTISRNATVFQSGLLHVGGAVNGQAHNCTILVKGGVVFGNSGTHTVASVTFIVANGGYMSLASEPNGVILTDAATISVARGGNLTVQSSYGIQSNDRTNVSIANYGDIYYQPLAFDNFVSQLSVPLFNYGNFYVLSGQVSITTNSTWHETIEVTGSTLLLTGGSHLFAADSTLQGNGTLEIQNDPTVCLQGKVTINYFVMGQGGATVTIDNTLATTSFTNFQLLDGTLRGTPTTIQQFTWAGGYISVSDLDVGVLQIIGAFTASISNTSLTVLQSASFDNTTHLLLFNSSTFLLSEGAEMVFDYEIFVICEKNDTGSTLQIGGELLISYPSLITLTCGLIILPTGVLTTTAGLLDIQTPITSSGSLNISAPSAVILETISTFYVGSSIIGSGTLYCQSCTAQISGLVAVGTLNFPAGAIVISVDSGTTDYVATVQFYNQSGSSSLMLQNYAPANLNFTVVNMKFSGGNVTSNHNAQLNLQANFVITNSSTFIDDLPYLFTNVALINYGTTIFYGNGNLKLWQTNFIYNAPSGTIRITGGTLDASQNDQSGYLSEIRNDGTFSVDVGATAQLALNVNNQGYLQINGIVSVVSGFFTQGPNSVSNIATSGSMSLTNPGLVLGGELKGTGQIAGTVILNGGTVHVDDSSALTISTLFVRAGGIIAVDVASNGMLKVQSLCQISGGSLALYSDNPVAYSRQFASAPSVMGSGFTSITNASLNSTFGFSMSNTSSGLFANIIPLPEITNMAPLTGPHGTVVQLTGNNFFVGESALNISILFQGVAVPASVVNLITLSAVVPIGTGTVSVEILSDGRLSNQLQWTYSAPTITSISPTSGPTIGPTNVTIVGSNFGTDASVVQVTFGIFGSCTISQVIDTQIICIAPPGVGANVSVTVKAGQQSSAPIEYTYDAPMLQSVYPSALVKGGNSGTITITGQNMASSATGSSITIQIGAYTCGNVTQVSLTTFTCAVPPVLLTAEETTSYSIHAVVAGQTSSNLTFQVFVAKPQPPPASKHQWWPVPWWLFLVVAVGLVGMLGVGLVIGCVIAKRSSGGDAYVTPGYEPIVESAKRSSLIN